MLRINQNISAMQGHYYLQMNENSYNTSIERLSSGLRINKAADDPAGLVISEKYRSQVDGLQQAINNSKDGVGMIQTAEGAMDEMNTLLRNMRTLALHAANTGTTDTDAAQADQSQINSMVGSLNKIVDRTKFGTKALLDGSNGVAGSTSGDAGLSFVSATGATTAGKYNVTVSAQATKGDIKSSSTAMAYVSNTIAGSATATINSSEYIELSGDLIKGATGSDTYRINLTSGDTLASITATLAADTKLSGIVSFTVTAANLTIKGDSYIGGISVKSSSASCKAATGIDTAVTALTTTTLTAASYSAFKTSMDESFTFRDVATGLQKDVTISKGTTLANAKSALAAVAVDAGVDVAMSGTQFDFTSRSYGSAAGSKVEMKHSDANTANIDFDDAFAAGTFKNIAKEAYGGGVAGTDITGTIDGVTATGAGQVMTSTTGNSKDVSLKYTGTGITSGSTVTVAKSGLDFQVGAFQGQTATAIINDLHAYALGKGAAGGGSTDSLQKVDVTRSGGASEALSVIDKAIAQLSSARGDLGSFQKDVLESTVRNLGVAKQNLSSAESQIRDADMAQEMLNYSRSQILQQTGMAMLAQANQAPNQIMGLFR